MQKNLFIIFIIFGASILFILNNSKHNAVECAGDEHEEDEDLKETGGEEKAGGDDESKSAGGKAGEPDLSSSHDHFDKDGHHDDEFDHEAVTGSQKDAEEFKELSPEESKQRLGKLVDKMDANGDGKIDTEELTTWIVNSFVNLDKENSGHKFQESDENEDKKVTWPELVHKTYGYSEKEINELRNDNNTDMQGFVKMIDDERVKFDLADTNKDGNLDEAEFVAYAHPQNYPHMAPYEVQKGLNDFDKDKDGFISMSEYLGDDVKKMDDKALESEKTQFGKYDTNGDGKLDKKEMIAWLMPGFQGTAKAEVDHLIKETDKNKDGSLSKEEIVEQSELWVGSHATDYGKHLEDMKKEEL